MKKEKRINWQNITDSQDTQPVKPEKKEYLTDLRIHGATPEQVALSLFRNDKKSPK